MEVKEYLDNASDGMQLAVEYLDDMNSGFVCLSGRLFQQM